MCKLTQWFKLCVFILISVVLSACVTVEPPKPVVVNGYAGYLEKIALTKGCKINISIIDFNRPGVIISQKNFDVAKTPVPFKFILPAEVISNAVDYGVVAMITYQGKAIFQTYDRYHVINNGKYSAEVLMKRVK
ncbi:YbaY family lipoprotein [Shewanella inventionis]|uniref:Chaperone for general secretion pathway YbaY n=1 Tax=Shewanella inventionis TaxID=1738770 RepID=A0ABQ1IPH2_9GAMM|nr:YbaY family lipoprotein [Shewanella inventionis]MCL1157763.1 YbaY family lipoprotein [Shewanella inventionis]UAL42495.1 YbaY family lipoprotein [Shewanella inventionis]GGB47829.1 chaperone for general secretion pathway YbaY [Shewanella inventionis]